MKSFRPYTPSRRFITVEDFSNLTRKSPEKSLTIPIRKSGGRNNTGEIMVHHRGGGHRRRCRIVDFRRDKIGIPGRVVSLEYDPNRSARLALIVYADGEKRYILAPLGVSVGAQVNSGPQAEIRTGNALELRDLPDGTLIHNIEMSPGQGGKLVRSAGGSAQLLGKDGGYAQVKLPSGEVRLILERCRATIGQVGNPEHENITLGNAGRSRHLGIRPTVRGTAMNTVDHPHGGGRGKSKGAKHPVSPWNQPTKGYRTRSKKPYDHLIIARRKKTKKRK